MKSSSALLVFILWSFSNSIAQVSEPPNFIFIVLDDLNDFVGYLENRTGTSTPAFDQLSSRGVSFVNAYANSPLCAPSRTSFLTGKGPDYTGLLENDDYTDLLSLADGKFRGLFDSTKQIITIPEYLKDSANYYTYGLGKVFNGWYNLANNDNDFDSLTLDPCDRGLSWNDFADYPTSPTAVPIDSPAPHYQGVTTFRFSTMPDSLEGEMEDTEMINSAMSFLDQYAANPGDFCDRPFFLGVGIHKPHAPRYIPERYFSEFYKPDLFEEPYDIPFNIPANAWPPNGDQHIPRGDPIHSDFDRLGPFAQLFALGVGGEAIFDTFPYVQDSIPVFDSALDTASRYALYGEIKRALYTLAYEATVSYVDHQINRLISKLEEHPSLYSNTVIVLTSDHGHTLGQKKHWRKGCLWDTDLHVPLIIVDPRRSTGGQLNYSPVSLLDLFPTFCEMADLPLPMMADGSEYPDGESLLDLLDEPSITWNRSVASLVSLPTTVPLCREPFFSIHDAEFHYIRYDYSFAPDCSGKVLEEELYHIGTRRNVDRYELNNLANDPAYAQIKNYLISHIPDDNLSLAYSRPLASLRIKVDSLPCGWTATDSLDLMVEWLNQKGDVIPTGPGAAFSTNWYQNGVALNSGSTTLRILPERDSLGRCMIDLSLSDSLGRVFALDRLELSFDDDQPDPKFEISAIDSSSVSLSSDWVQSYNYEQSWDWGDLTVLEDALPAPHTYLNPGSYSISRKITSTQDKYAHCVWSYDTIVTLDSSSFRGTCNTPLPPTVLDASADRFLMQWTPVYQADNYNIRFKKAGRRYTNFNTGNVSDTSTIAGPLVPGKQWEVSIQAVCGAAISDWSWPAIFENPTCQSPGKPFLTDLTIDSVYFSWLLSPDATLGYDILLRQNGAPNRIFQRPANTSSFAIDGLQPSTAYRIFMRSRCHQVVPGTYEPSKHVSTVFATPGLAVPRRTDLMVWPNPASSAATIAAIPLEQATRALVLLDMNGKIRAEATIPPTHTWHSLSLDQLPAGIYTINILHEKEVIASAKLTIQ